MNLLCFAFYQNHFLYPEFDRKVLQLVVAGLSKNFLEEYQVSYGNSQEEGPVVLTTEHLRVGFQIWLICLTLPFGCFCLELLIKLYRKIIK